MEITALFYIGVAVLTGLIFGKLAKLCHLPNVTGYLVGGLIVGPSVMGQFGFALLPENGLDQLGYFSDLALGFIAFTIGTNFKIDYFKRVGSRPVIIAIFESLFAVLFVLVVLLIFKVDFQYAILLSAIAAATAPAATVMVIKQYKARGETTETLMSVVALDDAVALILFGFAAAIANSVGNPNANMVWSIAKPFLEVIASLALGTFTGFILTLLLKWFTGRGNKLCCVLAIVLLTSAVNSIFKSKGIEFEISSLLACMMIGTVFCNLVEPKEMNKVIELVDRFTPPFLIMFFVMSGAELNLQILPQIGLVGIIYVIMRSVGKIAGAWFGGTITKAPKPVRNYLGFALIPQAGVAIGLTVVAGSLVPDHAAQIRAVILCGTLIYELIGPAISKFALTKAGDIAPQTK